MALEQLRAFRADRPESELGPTRRLEPDGFPLLESSELAAEHAALEPLIAALNQHGRGEVDHPELDAWLARDAASRTRAYLALLERMFSYDAKLSATGGGYAFSGFFDYGPAALVLARLLDAGVDREAVVLPTLEWFTSYRFVYYGTEPLLRVIDAVTAPTGALSELLVAVHGQCLDLGGHHQMGQTLRDKVAALLGPGPWEVLPPCEIWTGTLLARVGSREPWLALLRHCHGASSARPSAKWSKTARALADAVGRAELRTTLLEVFPLVDKARPRPMVGPSWENVDERQRMHELSATVLRGLVWLTPELKDAEVTRAVSKLAGSAYRKVRGLGPRAPKVGNACIYALSEMASPDSVGQLAVLRARVKSVPAQKELDKAFSAAAAALGYERDQIVEMSVPTYGLEEVGLRRESLGDVVGEVRVDGTSATLAWLKADKPVKSVPASVKKEHKEELKELQASIKDLSAMLPAQRDRIDASFLARRRWPLAVFRERYLDHPLVGTLARRLIWSFSSGGGARAGSFHDGRFVDALGAELRVESDAEVELWHPIGCSLDEIAAWRALLERHELRQPFKQAHRELYVLTDAERTTSVYSNRYAAHILRQHQLNALATARGWRAKLRMMVDDEYPPLTRALPAWDLRAELWVEGAGDEYGRDTNESGAYLRVASDQVRFYRATAAENSAHAGGGGYTAAAAGPGPGGANAPIPLADVPALVFSEVMRDVDLFVGVTSVGNDPAWQDGGPEGRYLDYWRRYAFGELSETAQTRRAVLERLLPKLKIADRVSLEERFLVVRGSLRTYRIHLGSGNILMEPNDQYLCIVPSRGEAAVQDRVFLPFEGDSTLSVVLSKAFMLAADEKIEDPTITSQIARR